MKSENSNMDELEERLIKFASLCICIAERMPNSVAGQHYAKELIRSSGNTALLCSSMELPESPAEHNQKMNVILGEIRESSMFLKIIARKPLLKSYELVTAIKEANELNSIIEGRSNQLQRADHR